MEQAQQKHLSTWVQTHHRRWGSNLPLLARCVILGKSLNFSELKFLHQ